MFSPKNVFTTKTIKKKTSCTQNYVFTKNHVITKQNHALIRNPVFTKNNVFIKNHVFTKKQYFTKKLFFHQIHVSLKTMFSLRTMFSLKIMFSPKIMFLSKTMFSPKWDGLMPGLPWFLFCIWGLGRGWLTYLVNKWINTVFLEQLLAFLGLLISTNYCLFCRWSRMSFWTNSSLRGKPEMVFL